MKNKILLIFLGLVAVLTVISATDDEQSLSQQSFSEVRAAREADPGPRRPTNKVSKRRSKGGKNKGRGNKRRSKGVMNKGRGNKRRSKGVMNKGRGNKRPSTKGGKNKGNGKRKSANYKKMKNKKKGSLRVAGRFVCNSDPDCAARITIIWKVFSANFDRQLKRISNNLDLGDKKNSKSGEFTAAAANISQAGGGDPSNLTCAGKPIPDLGAAALTFFYNNLTACPASVNASCNTTSWAMINQTKIDLCNGTKDNMFDGLISQLNTSATTCDKACKANAAGCGCWREVSLVNLANEVKDQCLIKDDNAAITKNAKACKSAFAECKRTIIDTVPTLSVCAAGEDGLKAQAKALAANKAAVTSAQAKVKALAGTRRVRSARAVPTNCTEVIDHVTKLLAAIATSASGSDVATYADDIANTPSSVTCSDDEKTSLKEQESAIQEGLDTIDEDLSSVQSSLEALTGTTLAANELTTASETTTKSSRLLRKFRNNYVV